MRTHRYSRFRRARHSHTGGLIVCALVIAFAAKAFSAFGGTRAAAGLLGDFIARDGTAMLLVETELSGGTGNSAELAELLLGTYYQQAHEPESETPETPAESVPTAEVIIPKTEIQPEEQPKTEDNTLFYNGRLIDKPGAADNSAPLPADGIFITNKSGLEIDVEKLLSEPLEINAGEGQPKVLIIHTHSSEAYMPDYPGQYEESDPYRTENKEYNIIKAGDALASKLAEYGVSVIHDRGVYDYPSYSGAYGRTLETVKKYLAEHPDISFVIDLHRDAMEAADGTQYKTVADINGIFCSQIMLVVGTNASGLEHPLWRDNMKFALRLQAEMNRAFPTLARPVNVSQYRYNQHLSPGYLIVETGSTGNTLAESITAVEFFAEAYAAVVLAASDTNSQ